ncbi:MAG: dynein gamma chain protein [Coriobacteriia bacterium]|nr:dynein gamma chain protein [Coriobacteriia bacterium]
MCTDGVNASQLASAVEQIDEAVALCRRWTHRAYHRVDEAEFAKSAKTLKKAQELLDDVRALLDEAGELIEREAEASAGISVKAV